MTKFILIITTFLILIVLERKFPLFSFFKDHEKLKHDFEHILFAILNGVLGILVLIPLLHLFESFASGWQYSLLGFLEENKIFHAVGAILLFDFWMYVWHRANHEIRFFWRFHKVHHLDKQLDASSAFRFHPGEVFLSGFLRLLPIAVIGMSIKEFIIYEAILLPVILFHHSNLALPVRLENFLRTFIVTPKMHHVHHSNLRHETDSNYGSIFSFWDKFWLTYRFRKDEKAIEYGVGSLPDPSFQKKLVLPFLNQD